MASTKRWLSHIFLYPVYRLLGFDMMALEGSTDLLLLETNDKLLGEDR